MPFSNSISSNSSSDPDYRSIVLESLVRSGFSLSNKSLEFFSYLQSTNQIPPLDSPDFDSLIITLYNNFISE